MYKKLIIGLLEIIFVLIFSSNLSFCEDTELEKVKSKIPELLGANNIGTEFLFTIPPCYEESYGYNFIKLFISSGYNTNVLIEITKVGLEIEKNIKANEVIEVNLSPTDGQPYTKEPDEQEVPEKVYEGRGIHVKSEHPIVVYCVVRYNATSDGFLALPISSLGKEYIATPYSTDPMFKAVWNYHIPSMTGIVAAYDGTEVKFTLGGNPDNETAGGLLPGESSSVIMNKGDVYMISSKGDYGNLSGSKIVASKPVAVVSGVQCTNIPVGNQWCDSPVEMENPTFTWGNYYHVPQVPGRKNPSIIRIFSSEPNTTIYRDSVMIGRLTKSGGIINQGFIETRLVPIDEEPRSAIIHGDKPIYVTLYNPGVQEDGQPHPKSDPFTMSIMPIDQYQKEIIFSTPGKNGSGFPENFINIIYSSSEDGSVPDYLEFAKEMNGNFEWQKLSDVFGSNGEVFALPINGNYYAAKALDLEGNEGIYRIRSKVPFAAYSFGYGSYDSYGYPTSAGLKDIGVSDVIPPKPVWEIDCAGKVYSDENENMAFVNDKLEDNIESSGLSIINLDELSENYKFELESYTAGVDNKTFWSLEPIDIEKDAKAFITFTDRNGNDTTIAIRYIAQKMEILTDNPNFRKLYENDIETKRFKIKNMDYENDLLIKRIELSNESNGFEINLLDIELPTNIPPQEVIEFDLTFRAYEAGEFKNNIVVEDNCNYTKEYPISVKVESNTSVYSDYGQFSISNVMPNPLTSGIGEVYFSLIKSSWVTLEVYNMQGEIQKELVSGFYTSGKHRITINAEDFNSGVYYLVYKCNDYSVQRVMVINK